MYGCMYVQYNTTRQSLVKVRIIREDNNISIKQDIKFRRSLVTVRITTNVNEINDKYNNL